MEDCFALSKEPLPAGIIDKAKTDLAAELASIKLRDGIGEIWQTLRARNIKIAICSNLALSYGAAMLAALPDKPDCVVLSYEAGAIKPEPEIYAKVMDGLSMKASFILFTGDTRAADVVGPQAVGMQAMLIEEFEKRMG